jgi:hypothetical protein
MDTSYIYKKEDKYNIYISKLHKIKWILILILIFILFSIIFFIYYEEYLLNYNYYYVKDLKSYKTLDLKKN